jgi:guanylate kinase
LGAAIARLIVISGPSGAGKGTLIKRVMARVPRLVLSVSATTRDRRKGEREGREYFFLTEPRFRRWIREARFLEWAEYTEHLYGTPAQTVQDNLDAGLSVILEIELKGARQVLAQCPEALMIFIMPPSLKELERRLRGRKTESEEEILSRLARAKEEMAVVENKVERGLPPLHHVIVNDSVRRASDELAEIIERTREEDEQTNG